MGNEYLRPYSKRNQLEILAHMLDFCEKPRSRYQVMQKANTSFSLIARYLAELQNLGLVEPTESGGKYVTSPKGKTFIEKWLELTNLLGSEEKLSR